ncbi:MAG: asparagine synthetase A [Candidatus Bipolaricaulaceae bacterium]
MDSQQTAAVLRLTSLAMGAARAWLTDQGFVELLPVILAPVTDPLRHNTDRAVIEAYGARWHLTRSMIFHKQAAVLACPRIFSFSPNVRLEPPAWAAGGRHLFEFVQLDLEIREAGREEAMAQAEGLLAAVVEAVRKEGRRELALLGHRLAPLSPPFPRVAYREAEAAHGEGFEEVISRRSQTPTWIVDFPVEVREFYDREDPARPGLCLDMDLLYPQGYGEALSGGEREHLPDRIRARMQSQGLDPAGYAPLLALAESGLPPSAGFGVGMERLVRYLAGLSHIRDVRLFPRVPGEVAQL